MSSATVEAVESVVALGEVAEVVMGQSPAGEACNRSGTGTPLLNGPTEFGVVSPVPAQWTTSPVRFSEAGDILFCVRGSTGRMNIADQTYSIGRGIAAIRGATEADTSYIRVALEAELDNLLSKTTGTVFPNISGPDLRCFPIPWPSSDERRDVAQLADVLSARVASLRRLLNILGDTVLAECLSAFGERGGDDTITLPQAVRLVNGGAYTKGAAGTGRMVIRIKELTTGPSETTIYNDIAVPHEKSARAGDVLFAWSGSLGLWRWYGDDAIVNQHIFKVLPARHPVWLGWVHITNELEAFRDIAEGKATTMGHITKDHLDRTLVPSLTDLELTALTKRVEPLWDYQMRIGVQLQNTIRLRQFILPRLLSGELCMVGADTLAGATK